jgi:nucleoside-diphosphate-sugar epimerase
MNNRRIVVTGAKGDVGEFVVDYARWQGADVLAVDRVGRGDWEGYLSADLTDLGQVYDVLYGADAVINLAAISDPYMFPAAQTFSTNTAITYNMFQAAAHLGIRRVVSASSIQVQHPAFARAPIHYRYLPFDEDHPLDAHDEYGMSKVVGEACANHFAHHWGLTVVSLRITWSLDQERMGRMFPIHVPDTLPTPGPGKRWLPTPFYIDARDCARACYLAATLDLPPATHIPLILTARDSCVDMPSAEIARRYFPEAEIRPGLEGYNSIASGKRAEQVLGFIPEYSWRENKGGESR